MFEASAARIMIFQLSTIDNCLSKRQSKRDCFLIVVPLKSYLDSDSLELISIQILQDVPCKMGSWIDQLKIYCLLFVEAGWFYLSAFIDFFADPSV